MDTDFSLSALMDFIQFAADKGLVKEETARTWRIAAGKLLSDLSPDEEVDVRKIDVPSAARRIANRDRNVSPSTVKVYQQRTMLAIAEFTKWRGDPTGYEPRGTNGKSRQKSNGDRKPQPDRIASLDGSSTKFSQKEVTAPIGGLAMPYPLRPNFLAQIVVPRDLSTEEARRIGAFLLTLATDFTAVKE